MAPLARIAELIEESKALERSGKVSAALQKTAQAFALAEAAEDAASMAAVTIIEAWLRFRLGQYPQAAKLAESALAATNDLPLRAEAWLILGNCAGETDNLAACEDYLRRTADLCRELGLHELLVRALHNMCAIVYMPRGQFELSLATDQEALRIMEEHSLDEYRWGPLVTMAWVYWLTSQWTNAYATLDRLAEIMLPGSIGEGYYYLTLANLAVDQQRYQEAAVHYAKCRSIAEDCADPGLNATVRIGLSRWNRMSGEGPTARHWAQDALTIANRMGYRHFQGIALIELGSAAWICGERDAAELHLRAAEAALSALGLDFDLARARLALAALLVDRHHAAGTRKRIPEAHRNELLAAWRFIQGNGYGFLCYQERSWTYTLAGFCLKSGDSDILGVGKALIEQLAYAPAEALRISMLGAMQVWRGERLLPAGDLRQRRAGELLALLSLAPEHVLTDEQAAEAMSPEDDRDAARNLVYHATSTLRRVLEAELPDRRFPSRYLQVSDGSLRLCLPAGSSIDCLAFDEAVRRKEWHQAYALYRGDFLADHRLADWAVPWRERLSEAYSRVLLALAQGELNLGNWDAALGFASSLMARDPWHEEAVAISMQANIGLGNLSAARRAYLRLRSTLRNELGVNPQEELQQIYASISSRHR